VPVDSAAGETIEIEVPCAENAQDPNGLKPGKESSGSSRVEPNSRSGGMVSFKGGEEEEEDEYENLHGGNTIKANHTKGSLKQPSVSYMDIPAKTEDMKAKFRNVSYGDNPQLKPPAVKSGLESPMKVRAGAESLGATKAPDWTRHIKDSKRNLEPEKPDDKWRVFLNDDVKNFQEQIQQKSRGILVFKNSVSTSKYTVYNFLFLNLGQQFSRLANVYFLIIAVLQLFTTLSPTGRFSTAAPLSLV
jgi:hypothetical protein